MAQALRCDPRLAAAWVDPFWQFCQVLNLFRTKPYVVGLGYNSRQVLSLKDAVNEVLLAFQENGGPEALWVLRKYLPTYTPAVLGDQPARRGTLSRPATAGAAYYAAASPKAKAAAAAAAQELKPYTLI